MPDDDILTVAQVAAEFNVTAQTIRAWIRDGKLRASRVGKSHNILRGDVYAMLASATVAQRPQRAPDMWDEPARKLPASRSPREPEPATMWGDIGEGAAAALVSRQPG
jgi:excisionase family DNA binding protein